MLVGGLQGVNAMAEKKKVLIIDDDECIHTLLSEWLSRIDCEVISAYSGKESDAIIKDHLAGPSPDIDLVIADVMLPDDNGLDICKRIKKLTDSVPVVLITASMELPKLSGIDAGADGFIRKPCGSDEVISTVKAMLRIKALQGELIKKNADLLKSKEEVRKISRVMIHDVRNPLTTLTGYLQLIDQRSGDKLDQKMKQFLTNSIISCKDIEKIIDKLDLKTRESKK